MAMMSDAISHAVLPGIVAAFWLFGGEEGSVLATLPALLGAALAGLLTVSLTEALSRSSKVKSDAAIGIVFPALFSIGVLAVSMFFRNVHLDLDAVLYGEIAYAPFNTLKVGESDLGPESLWIMSIICLLNLGFVGLFYKELQLSTFDRGLAAAFGFLPGVLHYALMTLVSVTAVGAFQSVGAILIVAFLIIPPATAYLLTQRLVAMLALAVLIGAVASMVGYGLAIVLDASIAGMMAAVAGLLFGLAFFFSPTQGLVTGALRRSRQRLEFATRLLAQHLSHHEGPVPLEEVQHEFSWKPGFLARVQARAQQTGLIRLQEGGLVLTPEGIRATQTPTR
jgi:manganese/zinc/iron transport system permease protein